MTNGLQVTVGLVTVQLVGVTAPLAAGDFIFNPPV
jgi:hypothetical protein